MTQKPKRTKSGRLKKTPGIKKGQKAHIVAGNEITTNVGRRNLCCVCNHPSIIQIDEDLTKMLDTGDTFVTIGKRFGLSPPALRRHYWKHLGRIITLPKKSEPVQLLGQSMGMPPTAADLVYALRSGCHPVKLKELMEVTIDLAIKNPVSWNVASVVSLLKVALPAMKAIEISHQSGKEESAKIIKVVSRITGNNPELLAQIMEEINADRPAQE